MSIFDFFKRKKGAADRPMDLQSMALLQPENVISTRVAVTDLGTLGTTLKTVVGRSEKTAGAHGLVVAIIIKPGRQMRAWCEFVPKSEHSAVTALEEELRTVAAPQVSDVIAFAMYFARKPVEIPQIPLAWRQVAPPEQSVRIPEGIVAGLWPDEIKLVDE